MTMLDLYRNLSRWPYRDNKKISFLTGHHKCIWAV